MNANKLTMRIMLGMILGIAAGYAANQIATSPADAKEYASYFSVLSDIFLRMIKMIIAPLVFSTVVSGIANMGDSKSVGRVGAKSLAWFITASIISLLLGCLLANLLQPGVGLGMALPDAAAKTNLATKSLTFSNFLVNVFPKSIFEAFATNQILQILIFSIFFGLAIASLPGKTVITIKTMTDEAVHVMIKVTDFVMQFAPVGVFAAMAAAITSFVLPLGYSFNLDGSMLYQSFAGLFIAQAFGIDMPISQQIMMLGVLMVSSKGMAGVARASLVVVAAILPMFNLPESGLLLIMAIDQFLDMGRTAINVVGNSIATAVVAKWEGQLGETSTVEDTVALDDVAAAPAKA